MLLVALRRLVVAGRRIRLLVALVALVHAAKAHRDLSHGRGRDEARRRLDLRHVVDDGRELIRGEQHLVLPVTGRAHRGMGLGGDVGLQRDIERARVTADDAVEAGGLEVLELDAGQLVRFCWVSEAEAE